MSEIQQISKFLQSDQIKKKFRQNLHVPLLSQPNADFKEIALHLAQNKLQFWKKVNC